jgi:hypothetical protein
MIVDIPNMPTPPTESKEVMAYISNLNQMLFEFLMNLSTILSGQLECNNLASYFYASADSGEADTEITITHGLGRIPSFYVWNIDQAGTVYDSRRSEWTTNECYVKCSAANAKLNILVIR